MSRETNPLLPDSTKRRVSASHLSHPQHAPESLSKALPGSNPSSGTNSKSNSNASSTLASPFIQPVRLESHIPGRATTFSLLMGSTPQTIRSRSVDDDFNLYQAEGSEYTLPAASGSLNRTDSGGSSAGRSPHPYRYHDPSNPTAGYSIVFPPKHEQVSEEEEAAVALHVSIGIWLSLIANILLFVTKTFSAVVSHSLSVAASAVDSFLDLVSQAVVFYAERGSKDENSKHEYPVGKRRLEPIGIILCASLMGFAALQLIFDSATELTQGYGSEHLIPDVDFDVYTLSLLIVTIVMKIALYVYCNAYAKHSSTLYALAVDHRNDVLSNVVALAAAILAWKWRSLWSADPIGAICMSVYICRNWFDIAREQVDLIVGKRADPEFIEQVRSLSTNFHNQLTPDIIRAYSFGAKYLVELEVVLPADMKVREAHDISLALQQSIEQLHDVERAFVHVDYKSRNVDEHDSEAIAEQVQGKKSPSSRNNNASRSPQN